MIRVSIHYAILATSMALASACVPDEGEPFDEWDASQDDFDVVDDGAAPPDAVTEDPHAYLDALSGVVVEDPSDPGGDAPSPTIDDPMVIAAPAETTESCGVCDETTSCSATCGTAYCRFPYGWVESLSCTSASNAQCNPVACGGDWYYCTNGIWAKGPDTGTRYAYDDDMVCNPEAKTMQAPAVHTGGGVDDMNISGTCEFWYKAIYETSYHHATTTATAHGCMWSAMGNAETRAIVMNQPRYRLAYRWNYDGGVPDQGVVSGNWEQRVVNGVSAWDDTGLTSSVAYLYGMNRLLESEQMALGGPGYSF